MVLEKRAFCEWILQLTMGYLILKLVLFEDVKILRHD